MNDPKVHLLTHPLARHRISTLRDASTCSADFRRLVGEIALMLGYEATKDLALAEREVRTPLAVTRAPFLAEKICLVPILRAGLGMLDPLLGMFPAARVGHIGLYRDPKTMKPVEYYCKTPSDLADSLVLVIDPMLATGGSSSDAIALLKKRGARRIRMLNIFAAPEGLAAVRQAHPDVEIYLAQLDEKLNAHGYILPGVGDAGDRIFGTL